MRNTTTTTTATSTEAGRAAQENATQRLARLKAQQAELRAHPIDTTTPLAGVQIEDLPADLPDVRFQRGPARRPVERPREPLLQWATGLRTVDNRIYAGWLIERDKYEDVDAAMEQADFKSVVIRHGSGNVVTHWALPVASLFVVCDGVQTMAEMRESQERYGIAFGWRGNEGRPQSVLRARVFVQELCAVGYTQPLLLSVKSTLTGDVLNALVRHYAVLDQINPIRATKNLPAIGVPFYAVALRLGAGSEVQRGAAQSKEITPMIEHGTRDQDYIKAHWCKKAWVEAIESQVDSTIVWSRSESTRIAAGDPVEEE